MNVRLLLLLLPLLLVACSRAPSGTESPASTPAAASTTADTAPSTIAKPDSTRLDGYHWQLQTATDANGRRIDALFARKDEPVQLDFAGGRVSVSHTCNRMSGSYQANADTLRLGPMVSTRRACLIPAISALDDAVASRLQGELALQRSNTGGTPVLRLSTATGDVLAFAGRPNAQTRYGGPGETMFFEVAPEMVPCEHPLTPEARCLRVREIHYDANGLRNDTPGQWQTFAASIEGYHHENGVRNVIRVKRYKVDNPPADAPSEAYVLDMVVESGMAGH